MPRYAQTSLRSEHPFEAADGPGISVVPTERRPLLRRLGVLCVLEIGGLCSPKMWPGPHFDTFGVWPRQPTTFGPRGTLCLTLVGAHSRRLCDKDEGTTRLYAHGHVAHTA